MLARMGYQKGTGLGKNMDGRAEPVDLLIKDKRQVLAWTKSGNGDETNTRNFKPSEVSSNPKNMLIGSAAKIFVSHYNAQPAVFQPLEVSALVDLLAS